MPDFLYLMFLSIICLWDFSMSLYTVVVVLVTQSCLILCDPMDCSPPGSSVHGILQARILEWVTMPSSRGSSWPRDWVPGNQNKHNGGLFSHYPSRNKRKYMHICFNTCPPSLYTVNMREKKQRTDISRVLSDINTAVPLSFDWRL